MRMTSRYATTAPLVCAHRCRLFASKLTKSSSYGFLELDLNVLAKAAPVARDAPAAPAPHPAPSGRQLRRQGPLQSSLLLQPACRFWLRHLLACYNALGRCPAGGLLRREPAHLVLHTRLASPCLLAQRLTHCHLQWRKPPLASLRQGRCCPACRCMNKRMRQASHSLLRRRPRHAGGAGVCRKPLPAARPAPRSALPALPVHPWCSVSTNPSLLNLTTDAL